MRIGIDIDGVLTDIEKWILDYGSRFYYQTLNKQIINPEAYDSADIFDVDYKVDLLFWQKYFKKYTITIEPRLFASEVIKKLKEEGHEIYIVTARGNFFTEGEEILSFEENKKITLEWLNKHHIIYDDIFFSKAEKLNTCLENKIDLMIEDNPKNINKLSEQLPVICVNAGYNKDCHNKNITRCYSWYDIYAKIHNMQKKD